MCDILGCKKHPIKEVTVRGNTSLGTLTKNLKLCSEHLACIESGLIPKYSIGCHVEDKTGKETAVWSQC